MKLFKSKLRVLALAAGSLAITMAGANAATDPSYETNDAVLFFRNPSGAQGNTSLVMFSIGSTWDVFRDAATPGDATFGTVISLGNINTILTSTYGATWYDTTTLFGGVAGNNGSTSGLSSAIDNGDYARTVYATKPRAGAGTFGQANSSAVVVAPAGSSGTASAIQGGNLTLGGKANPYAAGDAETSTDTQNPISGSTPGTAYTSISGGVMGAFANGGSYTYGSIANVELALDLYRVTPVITGASAWQNVNSISGVTAGNGYYLGTVTVSQNGDVNFAAVPEPSTYALLALAGIVMAYAIRRRNAQA